MKIDDFAIRMSADHTSERRHEVKESLRAWVGERRPDFEGRARDAGPGALRAALQAQRVSISDMARAAQARTAEAMEEVEEELEDDDTLDISMSMLRAMTEMLTGRKVEVFDARELEDKHEGRGHGHDAGHHRQRGQVERAGFGIEYDRVERVEEREHTEFSAAGKVTTADGREISFNVEMTLDRHFVSESRFSLRAGDAVMQDPLVLNFTGSSAQLNERRISFDLNADGQTEEIPELAAGNGYLALDLNRNGEIDDGSELFGPRTGNGFAELARHDEDGNGFIDENDSVFDRLSIWRPGSTPTSLAAAGVGALYLGAVDTPFALRDAANEDLGALRASSVYLNEDGSTGLLQQIDLAV